MADYPESDLDLGQTVRGFRPGQRVLRRYTLERMVGRGGMGVVWLARDEELERAVALKFLPETLASDPGAIADLKREVRRAIDLAHPHIVKIHDFVTDGTLAAIAMEFVEGETLTARRVTRPRQVFTVADVAPWAEQLCGALAYAHEDAKLVHRDLKPVNIMVTPSGRVKILDFGIAASISESASRVSNRGTSGTLSYMSPQQLLGKAPSVSDDLYALGATLHELLTGKPPFFRGDVAMQVLNAPVPTISERRAELGTVADDLALAVPAAWEETIAACLAKEPDERPAAATEVAERLKGGGRPEAGAGRPEAGGGRREEGERRTGAEAGGQLLAPVAPDRSDRSDPTDLSRNEASPAPAATPDRRPLFVMIGLATLALVVWGGYYFGVAVPERERLAREARLQAEVRRAEEAARVSGQNAAKQRLEREAAAREQLKQEKAAQATSRPPDQANRVPERSPPAAVAATPAAGQPWTIPDLGMKFVPVPGTSVLFSVWETRVEDYLAFSEATNRGWKASGERGHPAANVSWEDAKAFCAWLTQRERSAGRLRPDQEYRLPHDWEWTVAVGLEEPRGGKPASKDMKIPDVFPWGTQWPPPRGAGNYLDQTAKRNNPSLTVIEGYDDGHAGTSPVGSFSANRYGLFDLGGNLWEWVDDDYDGSGKYRALRGASFDRLVRGFLLSSSRAVGSPDVRYGVFGFRVVCVVGASSR